MAPSGRSFGIRPSSDRNSLRGIRQARPSERGGPPGEGPRAGGGRGGGFGPGRFIGPGLFAAADQNKDGSLTRDELKSTFEKWFTDWDKDQIGSLDEEKLQDGLNAALPRPQRLYWPITNERE